MYLVSNRFFQGDRLYLFKISDKVENDPEISVQTINVDVEYSIAGDGLQLGTNKVMDTGDCRVKSGFYSNGMVHLVFTSDYQNGYAGVYYARIDTEDNSSEESCDKLKF